MRMGDTADSHKPHTRSEWSNLDWKAAQIAVAEMMNQNGFMIFEEKRLSSSNRTDVLVIKNGKAQVTIGIIEVKAYSKLSTTIEKAAIKQAARYLRSWYETNHNNNRWRNKKQKYFIAIVYTKDYPVRHPNKTISRITNTLPGDIRLNLTTIICTPNSLIGELQRNNIIPGKQSRIDDFF